MFGIGTGTAPTTAPADGVQLWTQDVAGEDGKASLHMMSETDAKPQIVAGYVIKSTAGDPEQAHTGLGCINTADKTIKVYADGGWRAVSSW